MKSRLARVGAALLFAIGLLGFDFVSASAAQVNVSTACAAFANAQENSFDGDSLATLSAASNVAVVPDEIMAAIDGGDQNTITGFFGDACVDPNDTTGSACLLFGGLSTDDADDRSLAASQLRFVLDNAASQIIADSLDELTDPSIEPAEPLGRIDAVFTAACRSVDLPAATTASETAPDSATAEPTATPRPAATATPAPDPDPTAAPEPTATPRPAATAEPTPRVSSGAAPANLPQTGPGDFTLGLAKAATIVLGAGLFFLALEGHAHFRGRRLRIATVATNAAPTLPPLTPSAMQGSEADLGTLADVRYRDRPSAY